MLQVHTVYVPKEEPFATSPTAATTPAYPAVASLTTTVEMKRALKYRYTRASSSAGRALNILTRC